jgi:tripartite motif-containing protein 71
VTDRTQRTRLRSLHQRLERIPPLPSYPLQFNQPLLSLNPVKRMWRPSAIVVDDKGNRLIAASGNLLGLQDQNGQLLSWLGTYNEWVAYWTVGWHHPEERSHLTRDAGGKTIYSVPSQHEIVIGVPESQGPFQVFGSYGSEPGQLNTPTGVAVLGEPCSFGGPYTVDEHTLLLAHYDGDLDGEQGETAIATGTTFVQGKHNQGVLIDGSDSLAYPRMGNLDSWQGTIEFWIKPNWDGDDTGFYELFQIRDDFYDYSNHTMWLGKDPGGNLGSWGGIYENVSDLSAGEWYHIAVAWEGPEVTLYINGTLRQSGYGDPRDFTAEFFNVGSACCSMGNQVNAVIDELRISNIHRLGNNDTCSRILVADSGNDRIQVFDRSGKLVSAYGSSGAGSGQFDNPQGMAVDDLDNLIVVDTGNNRLQILDFDGTNLTFVKEILGEFNAPRDVAAPHHDQIVVADTGNNAIKVLDDEGHLLASYLEPNDGLYSGYFSQPHGLAVDLKGEIVVADTLNHRVVGILSPYVDPPVVQMNAGLNDAWFNPITSGQGFFITVFPEIEYVSLSWFTYDTERPDNGVTANLGEPGHRWLMALGTYSGSQALMDISITSGGVFDMPTAVTEVIDGTITLTFTDCENGTVEYNIPSIGQSGTVPIKRVVSDNIALCEALNTN